MSATGTLYVISAPSGAGKSSLIKAYLKQEIANATVSVSHTTRSPRPGEVDGEHYHFVDHQTFEKMIEEDAFFEWAKVFGNYYGTSKAAIEKTLEEGFDVFLDIDWQGARQVKQLKPDAKTIFIAPPSQAALLTRLLHRRQDSEEVINKRMAEAQNEISHYNEFEYIIVNDEFELALAELTAILQANRLTQSKQAKKYQALFAELLAKA